MPTVEIFYTLGHKIVYAVQAFTAAPYQGHDDPLDSFNQKITMGERSKSGGIV
jgi:hypothetical protein